ncbi:hypothetical protein QWM81_27625 [Streptomyces ficellus]|uniref:Uncharacterized protein n=1 Tax=Streptomyces ficellus TaxID=1977088 RepID=A0ABT7ZDZ2_9ACTN|nr:hypothetical protein [Streptomyces ficellus]MDN3297740.1 hypothetical protein [Streptomyces ficellus]
MNAQSRRHAVRVRSIVVLAVSAVIVWGSTGVAGAAAEQRSSLSMTEREHSSHGLVGRALEHFCEKHSGDRKPPPPFDRLCKPVNGWQ